MHAQVARRLPPRTTTCTDCAASFDLGTWSALPLIERVHHDDVGHLFTQWPWRRDEVLEIRRCTCGHEVVRLMP